MRKLFWLLSCTLNGAWDLIGLITALVLGAERSERTRGVLVVYVRRFPKDYAAITWHRIVIIRLGEDNVLSHELIHVEQYERWFGLFPIAYAIDWLIHGRQYENICFEREAYRRQKDNTAQ